MILPCRYSVPLLTALGLLAGCEAQIDIDLTDAAVDEVDQVVLQIEAVELRRADGATVRIDTDNGEDVDLLQLTNGRTLSLVSGREIGASRFTGVRLLYADTGSFVTPEDDDDVELITPADPPYAAVDFTLDDEGSVRLVIDLDLRFSLVDRRETGDDYQLVPYLRAAVPQESASITGRIDDDLVENADCRRGRDEIGEGVAIYVFSGTLTRPQLNDFVSQNAAGPIASAELQGSEGSYNYEVSLLAPGDYTVALTCDTDRDDPLGDDEVLFRADGNVTLREDQTEPVDLEF